MKLTRYTDDAPVDYMILDDEGEWVPASEALELQVQLKKARELLAKTHEHLEYTGWGDSWERSLVCEPGGLRDRLQAFLKTGD